MSKRSLFVRLVPCRCLRGEEEVVTSLDYSHCSLETVPKEIFSFEKTLQELYLDANQIEELPKQLFNCQLLNRLSVPDNELTVLPAAIANLVNLRELDVSKNGIGEFPENIKNCKALTVLEASVNPILKLPEGFTQLLSLTQLYLNDAFLEFLPVSFGRLAKLQILELRESQLNMLPKSMQKLTQLERLDLGNNEFTEVPEVLEHLTGLKELWMDGNKLTFLPGMLGMLKQLVYLDVSKNNLETIDEKISGCENLQDLHLSKNTLTQLPNSIGSLKKLTALKVDENQLMYLPDSIGGLTSIDELDCSFNEIEALPSSIGQCVSIRTFAADHNFLTQLPPELGNWKSATVLFLHSNKLESLPEEMGDMQKLKVINLSNNKLKNLPYSFTKLTEMTAIWLSENQSKPLIPLQKEEDPETHKVVLTNYMFPQQTRTEDFIPRSDSESFNPALWEEQRKQRAQVAFECDEDKDERETPPREGNLKRYPTPYPDELKNMVKTAQSVAHRLKEDETSDESGKESKPIETNHIGVQDVGVKDPEELTDEEEMKIAEMRPPLIEISINQPKVVTLSKDKKDDGKDADSLLDDTVANSNQNNSNCSSPSRMSDSVSLTTDSSQDNSLCTPERESKMPFLLKNRHEDENMNQPKDTTPLLHNGNGSETSPDYDLSVDPNGMEDAYTRWDQINMNVTKLPAYNAIQLDELEKAKNSSVAQEDLNSEQGYGNDNVDHLQNGNQQEGDYISGVGNKSHGMRVDPSPASTGVTGSSDMSLSRSTEELSPEKRSHPPQVVKSHSVGNIETGGLKLYSFEVDDDSYDATSNPRMTGVVPGAGAQGQSIVRSKSAGQLLNEQNLLVYPGSFTSSSDVLSSCNPLSSSSNMSMGLSAPQYNIQYTSSTVSKDGIWGQRAPIPPDHQGYLPPHPHSLANTNYSNRNQAPPYPLQPQQRGVAVAPKGDWAKERLHSTGGQPKSSTLQRQSSNASSASMGDARRLQVLEGDYMTYRNIHTLARGPLAMSQAAQRPLSARAYSIDAPLASRPVSSRPQAHELPERTMSVSDFNYQHSSPSKRPNTRVKSEHSLLDGVGPGRVPADWRDQVMRHIEAKKMEKTALSRSYNFNSSPLGWSHYGSCRDMHGSQGALVFSGRDGHPYGALSFCDDVFVPQGPQSYSMDPHRKVPLMNGQMGPSVCPPMSHTSMARHPSREQLIDYLMLKVSQQPHGAPRIPPDTLQKEMRVKVEKNPELGFSISGGVGGRGNPFHPDDNGIYVTRVQPEGPASKILQPGDKIIQANGYSFVNIDHGKAVSLLKTLPTTVDLTIIREVQA